MQRVGHELGVGLGLLIAVLALMAPSLSCRSSAGGAVINTAIAVGASAVNRSRGGCYAICTMGTVCNHETGYCDSIPCDGKCRVGETCQTTPTGYACMADSLGTPGMTPPPTQVPPAQPGAPGAAQTPTVQPAQPGAIPGSTPAPPGSE